MTERPPAPGGTSTGSEDTNPRLRLGKAPAAKQASPPVSGRPPSGPSSPVEPATGPAATAVRPAVGRGPRRARLTLTRVDPWSVMKVSFLLSVALGVATFIAVLIVWGVLSTAGLWESINDILAPFSSETGPPLDVRDYISAGRVLGFTLVVSVLDVILLTALATLGAFVYNLSAALLGGVQVTLTEEDHR